MIFMPKTPATRLSGMKKNARCVNFETTSASAIARSLSTMLMLDMSAWKSLSTRRLARSTVVASLPRRECSVSRVDSAVSPGMRKSSERSRSCSLWWKRVLR